MDGADVAQALAEFERVLNTALGRDWAVRAGDLDWTCRDTAIHIAHDLLAYAGQLAAAPQHAYLAQDLTVRPDASPADVLAVVAASGRLLQLALDAAGPSVRAWHWGPTDPSGFAALGVNEILVHTWDIAQGLALPWRPPTELCAGVLERLVRHPPAGDPTDVLLWTTGRIALDAEHPRLDSWTFKVAG